jgi:hypothetical protein
MQFLKTVAERHALVFRGGSAPVGVGQPKFGNIWNSVGYRVNRLVA